jgi:hypothetical protein
METLSSGCIEARPDGVTPLDFELRLSLWAVGMGGVLSGWLRCINPPRRRRFRVDFRRASGSLGA